MLSDKDFFSISAVEYLTSRYLASSPNILVTVSCSSQNIAMPILNIGSDLGMAKIGYCYLLLVSLSFCEPSVQSPFAQTWDVKAQRAFKTK